MSDQSVPDLSKVSLQSSFIDSRHEKPSAVSTLYLRRFSTKNVDGEDRHTVIGVHVVLAKGNPNGLWEALHVDRATQRIDGNNPRVATRSLVICCDKLEVHGEFSLPEANVDVFARHLVWADDAASINTSPLAWTTEKARNASGSTPGQNGAEGRKAGSLRMFVREVSPAGSSQARLIARGGRGQDPGAGQDGTDGESMDASKQPPDYYSSHTFSGRANKAVSRKKLSFDPPAVYIEYEWWWLARVAGPTYLGVNHWPKDGTAALAPGVPGSGGHGGSLTTNHRELAKSLRNAGGAAGIQERDYKGGNSGSPAKCAKYRVKLYADLFGTEDARFECEQTDIHSVKGPGASAQSKPAARLVGDTPATVIRDAASAWLHPLSLQAALEYARDLFLAGGREELHTMLSAYHDGLCPPLPPADTGAWTDVPASEWTAAQTEVSTMMQRLAAHLDYFGNPAGYTPLLSLSSSIRLYDIETKDALKMMLIAGWVNEAAREASEQGSLLTEALDATNEDSKKAAAQVTAYEGKIKQIQIRIETLKRELTDRGTELFEVRKRLLAKVTDDVNRHAPIKFAMKMAGALCQVIPVGQPALGVVGSLVGATSDLVGGNLDDAPDTLTKVSKVLNDANTTASIMATVVPSFGSDSAEDTAAAKKKSDALSRMAVGLSPAVRLLSEGLRTLQVPKSEVEAALARLEATDPAMTEVTDKIRDLNEKKAALFGDLAEAIQSVGEGFSRLAANAGAVVRFQQQRGKALGQVDPEAVYAVRQLGQRSQLRLQEYLYLLVKSYESTLLRPLAVDWKLTKVTEKISEQISEKVKGKQGITATDLPGLSETLYAIFRANLSEVRNQLLHQFKYEHTKTVSLQLNAKQTPDIIAALNKTGRAEINPLVFGLLLPDHQLARLSKASLLEVGFDSNPPSLTDRTNVSFSLVPARMGILRRDEGLYAVASDSPVRWGWTYLSAVDLDTQLPTRVIRPDDPSAASKDLLDFILGESTIRGQVSLPPMWSELVISVLFPPDLPYEDRPRLEKLHLHFEYDWSAAPVLQKVLSIRATGTPPGAVVACTKDVAGRGDGSDNMLRIYNKGETVQLSVPAAVGGAVFDGWVVGGVPVDRSALTSTSLKLTLNDHAVALSRWKRTGEASRPLLATALATARPIRVAPQPDAAIVAVIPPDGVPDVLESGSGTWQLVNYRGVVGWTEAEAAAIEAGWDIR